MKLGDIDVIKLHAALMDECDRASLRSKPGDDAFMFDHTHARILFSLAKALREAIQESTNATS